MKRISLLSTIITLMLVVYGCIKTSDLIPKIPPDDNPSITEPGIPVGEMVTKTIGKEGGSISSADGNAELIFPAGALDAATTISVQPISNTAPIGFGNGYSFLPEGIRFLQPVILKFHYTEDNLASTLAGLMGIAFQDSIGAWYRVNNSTNDSINKIISAPIRHFSKWAPFYMLHINPSVLTLGVGKSINLEVEMMASDDELVQLRGDDEVVPLTGKISGKKIVWAASSGTVASISSNIAKFTAPAKVPSANPVAVSATIDNHFKYEGKTYNNIQLISNIRIVDTEVYLLEMRILDTVLNTDPDVMVVWDSVSMKITIRDSVVTISEITNFPSSANPTQLVYTHDADYFVPDPVGEINVTAVSGKIGPYAYNTGPDGRLLGLNFTHSGTHDPKLRYTAENNYEDFSGGEANNGYPTSWAFEILPNGEVGEYVLPLNGIQEKVVDVKLTLQK